MIIIKGLKKYFTFFVIGGIGYALVELIWRGRTHWTMIIAGGICFISFSVISELFREKPILYKAVLCSLTVTTIELIFGVLFNIILKMNVWNYGNMPLNFLGQICPLYSLLWCGLSLLTLPVAQLLNKKFGS